MKSTTDVLDEKGRKAPHSLGAPLRTRRHNSSRASTSWAASWARPGLYRSWRQADRACRCAHHLERLPDECPLDEASRRRRQSLGDLRSETNEYHPHPRQSGPERRHRRVWGDQTRLVRVLIRPKKSSDAVVAAASEQPAYFAVGIANSGPFALLSGHRCMIDFCRV